MALSPLRASLQFGRLSAIPVRENMFPQGFLIVEVASSEHPQPTKEMRDVMMSL